MTSHDVVARERRKLPKGTKVGHAGTLDPFATGLLLLLIGRATRVQRFLMALPKTYVTTARLGYVSDTGDRDGTITEGRMPASLEIPVGPQLQTPPAFSAKKVQGKRAYALARAGEAVELEPVDVVVYRRAVRSRHEDRAEFELEVSAGTYIRRLIMDLGDAYCESLRRTAIGPFSVDHAGSFLSLDDAVGFIPEVRLSEADAKKASHGVAVPGQAEGTVRLTDADGLIALAEPRGGGLLKPTVGFRG